MCPLCGPGSDCGPGCVGRSMPAGALPTGAGPTGAGDRAGRRRDSVVQRLSTRPQAIQNFTSTQTRRTVDLTVGGAATASPGTKNHSSLIGS